MFANEIPRQSILSGFIVNDSYGLLVSKSQINKITIIINVINEYKSYFCDFFISSVTSSCNLFLGNKY